MSIRSRCSAPARPAACRASATIWGACDPANPKNRRRRCSLLVERIRQGRHARRCSSTRRPTCASSCSMPASTRSTACSSRTITPTTRTASTICAAVALQHASAASTSTSTPRRAPSLRARFDYCFAAPPGSAYPPILKAHDIRAARAGPHRRGRAARSRRCRSCRSTATSPRSASASATWPIRPTSAACPEASLPLLRGSICGSSMRCGRRRIRAISRVKQALEWIERLGAEARHPDAPARRSRLRDAEARAAAARRARLRRHGRALRLRIGWPSVVSAGARIHHARNICARSYPRIPWCLHTACIPLHSRGRRTREASHGEGGLQADREVRTSGKRGSAYSQG